MTSDSLAVDIGGATGALIAYARPDLVGREIEITSAGGSPGHAVHNVVRPRRVGHRVVHAAVFPDLPAGTYRCYRDGVADGPSFTVAGGRVTEIDWTLSTSMPRSSPLPRHDARPRGGS